MESLGNQIVEWNNQFPIDRWYRKTYSIPFNSLEHRRMCYIDICFDYFEGKIFGEQLERKKEVDKDPYIPGTGNFLVIREINQEMSDEEFDLFSLDD